MQRISIFLPNHDSFRTERLTINEHSTQAKKFHEGQKNKPKESMNKKLIKINTEVNVAENKLSRQNKYIQNLVLL